jgi:hypothetical protein
VISFFANGHGSGEIRGRQIAEHLGARLNPTEGYEDDVCVYVKRKPPENFPKRSYLDILDASARMSWLKKHPDMGVIASSLSAQAYLQGELERDVVYLPQHHCNFEREWGAIPTPFRCRLGVVGGEASLPEDFAQQIGATRYTAKTREEVVAAYLKLDIQVIWRDLSGLRHGPLKNALKIINAASFGIPTIALPEPGYGDMDGFYWPVTSTDELRDVLWSLRKSRFSMDAPRPDQLAEKAEEFHIDHIAKRYLDL